MDDLKRGQLYYIKNNNCTEKPKTEEQGKPVLVMNADKEIIEQNGTITVANITRRPRYEMDTHMEIQMVGYKAVAILEQEVTVSVDRLGEYIGELSELDISKVNNIVCKMRGIDLEGIIKSYEQKLEGKEKEITWLKGQLQKKEKRSFFNIFKK